MFKEKLPSAEEEREIQSKVVLEFMRHGKRDKDDQNPDAEIRLNEEGRIMSQKKGKSLSPQKEVSLAWGSQLRRAQETAIRAMLPEIDVGDSLEDIEQLIVDEQKVGKKLIVDPRLGYNLSGPSGKETYRAFKEGRYIPYVVEESDQAAITMNDKVSTTYLRHAGNIAEIISRYAKIGKNFNQIVTKKEDEYKKYDNRMERYLGTHSGILEFFLIKVKEKVEGIDGRDEFIKYLGDGFKETEGMRVEIINVGSDQQILVHFTAEGKDEEILIDDQLLDSIIEERAEFEKKFGEGSLLK